MEFNAIFNKETKIIVNNEILQELRIDYGVQHSGCSKKTKGILGNKPVGLLFQRNLEELPLTDIVLFNGNRARVPKFLEEACSFISEHGYVEGIFRKAGSSLRQKKIRESLDAGLSIGNDHHVIDVANVVKQFFRALKTPLIACHFQETLLKCIATHNDDIKPILLTCLLLPALSLNTLAFFMQFLHRIALNESVNKMSAENLAIVLAPSLMPFANKTPTSLSKTGYAHHVQLIRLLIENGNSIGGIPAHIVEKISSSNDNLQPADSKKRRKRRSDMFVGLKKIVGTTLGASSENLDNSYAICSERGISDTPGNHNVLKLQDGRKSSRLGKGLIFPISMTPHSEKSMKKSKTMHPNSSSIKKTRDFRALLPVESNDLCPGNRAPKESKKSRISFGGHRFMKTKAPNPDAAKASVERRWSITGPSFSKLQAVEISNTLRNKTDQIQNVVETCDESVEKLRPDQINTSREKPSKMKMSMASGQSIIGMDEKESNCIGNGETLPHNVALEDTMPEETMKVQKAISFKLEKPCKEKTLWQSPRTTQLSDRLNRQLSIQTRSHPNCSSPNVRRMGTFRRYPYKNVNRQTALNCHSSTKQSLSMDDKKVSSMRMDFAKPMAHIKLMENNSMLRDSIQINDEFLKNENWTPGEVYFTKKNCQDSSHCLMTPKSNLQYTDELLVKTPAKPSAIKESSSACTPMLPPRSVNRRNLRTPNSSRIFPRDFTGNFTPLREEMHERDSIVRIRANNFGNVAMKAKLFDGLGNRVDVNAEWDNHKSALQNPQDAEKLTRKDTPSKGDIDGKMKIPLNESWESIEV